MKNKKLIGVGIIAVIAVIGGVLFLSLSNPKETNVSAVTPTEVEEVVETESAEPTEKFAWEDKDIEEGLPVDIHTATSLYEEPREVAKVVTDLSVGTRVTVTAECWSDGVSQNWYKAVDDNGNTGYVSVYDFDFNCEEEIPEAVVENIGVPVEVPAEEVAKDTEAKEPEAENQESVKEPIGVPVEAPAEVVKEEPVKQPEPEAPKQDVEVAKTPSDDGNPFGADNFVSGGGGTGGVLDPSRLE